MDWPHTESYQGHATYIDSKMLRVTKYSFHIYFQYSACGMMQAKLHNSRAISPTDISSAAFVFDEDLVSIAKLEIVQ